VEVEVEVEEDEVDGEEGVEEEEGEVGVGILAEAPGGMIMVQVSVFAIITRIPLILCHLQVWISLFSTLSWNSEMVMQVWL
jgi:hypothetical protein